MAVDEPNREDDELYRAWVGGDAASGGALVDRHLRSLARFFANKVGSPSDAEELVGQTFEICSRKLGDWSGTGTFRSYLFGIAHNVLRNYLRSKRRGGREIDPATDAIAALGPSPVTLVGDQREQRLLLEALRQIPVEHQLVLEMAYFEDLSRTEIAQALGIPAGTVASRTRRAHELLTEALSRIAGEPELLRTTLHGLDDWARSLRAGIG